MVNNIIAKPSNKVELSYYTEVPISKLQYEEFKELCKKRIDFLKTVEAKGECSEAMKDMVEDLSSHAALRLVCSTSSELKLWFLRSETKLFRMRCERNRGNIEDFFVKNIWPYMSLPGNSSEKKQLATESQAKYNENVNEVAINATSEFNLKNKNTKRFNWDIKIHFSKCSEILAKRTHEIMKGYFTMDKPILLVFIVNEFREYLTKKIDELAAQFECGRDERIFRLGRELFIPNDSVQNSPCIQNMEEFFPLCISGVITRFREKTHLKYFDRQMLCLFLKDIGVPLEDTVEFFRSNFKIPEELFRKEYLYGIRHNYGLEGKKANYKSFTCHKIASNSSDPNAFGCPFVNNHEFVRNNSDIEDIGKDAYKACMNFAKKKVGSDLKSPFGSPAEYFKEITKKLY